jgi:hypothetical protein
MLLSIMFDLFPLCQSKDLIRPIFNVPVQKDGCLFVEGRHLGQAILLDGWEGFNAISYLLFL